MMPAKVSKPPNMLDACRALEKETALPRSLRIQVPRVLTALYEIRNNRGVGHVGGDVDPNHMDAVVVLAMSKWIVAELVRVFHNVDTATATGITDALVEREVPLIWTTGDKKRVLNAKPDAQAENPPSALRGRPGMSTSETCSPGSSRRGPATTVAMSCAAATKTSSSSTTSPPQWSSCLPSVRALSRSTSTSGKPPSSSSPRRGRSLGSAPSPRPSNEGEHRCAKESPKTAWSSCGGPWSTPGSRPRQTGENAERHTPG